RTASLITALLAVLKSGAAYVPLDPQFPADRVAFMLEDSGAAILLVTGKPPPGVRLPPSLGLLDVEQVASMDGQPEANPVVNWNLSDPAYLIYTSGSTGQPKGVTVARRSLDNLLSSMSRLPGLSAGDTLAAVTTISFDIAA